MSDSLQKLLIMESNTLFQIIQKSAHKHICGRHVRTLRLSGVSRRIHSLIYIFVTLLYTFALVGWLVLWPEWCERQRSLLLEMLLLDAAAIQSINEV